MYIVLPYSRMLCFVRRDAKALQEKAARKAAQAATGGKENAGADNKNTKKK